MKAVRYATKLAAARALAKRNAPHVHAAIDRAAVMAKERTPARHHRYVDHGADLAKRAATGSTDPEAVRRRR
jgi:hypothetical protein